MAEYIEKQALRDKLYEADAITLKGVKIINQFPPADVRPVVDIDEVVDEAIRVLNAINASGSMDYADYCELHDAVCAISSNRCADMLAQEQEAKTPDKFEGWSDELKETYRKMLESLGIDDGDADGDTKD